MAWSRRNLAAPRNVEQRMPNARRLSLLASLVLAAVACSPAGGPPASAEPSSAPSLDPAAIAHPTGADEVVLRYEDGGGHMMFEWALTQVPIFTLYGDGTVVFRDPATQPSADADGLLAYHPMRVARLSEDQVQALLAFAINQGGLGVARDRYDHPMVADANTASFTLNAEGGTRTVEVYALGLDEGAPDRPIRAQFVGLADRLRAFDEGGALPTAEYTPHGWRAVLVESQGVPARTHAWPWPDLTPKDFVAEPEEPSLPEIPVRVLTAEEVGAMGLGELKGGLLGYYVKAPDGVVYNLPLRPLLPDEER